MQSEPMTVWRCRVRRALIFQFTECGHHERFGVSSSEKMFEASTYPAGCEVTKRAVIITNEACSACTFAGGLTVVYLAVLRILWRSSCRRLSVASCTLTSSSIPRLQL